MMLTARSVGMHLFNSKDTCALVEALVPHIHATYSTYRVREGGPQRTRGLAREASTDASLTFAEAWFPDSADLLIWTNLIRYLLLFSEYACECSLYSLIESCSPAFGNLFRFAEAARHTHAPGYIM